MSEGRIEPDPPTPIGQQGSENKGVGSLCFMTRGAAPLSSFLWVHAVTVFGNYRELNLPER